MTENVKYATQIVKDVTGLQIPIARSAPVPENIFLTENAWIVTIPAPLVEDQVFKTVCHAIQAMY